eukprot:2914967-Prymnesium_polylepis.1
MLIVPLLAGSLWPSPVARCPTIAASASPLDELVARVAQLGRECPWTAEQTPSSVLAFLKEEISEAEDVLDVDGPPEDLTSELGDLLFNVLLAVE